MSARKIVLFLGSTRQGRMGARVANYVRDVLQKNGLETKIFGRLMFTILEVLIDISVVSLGQ